MKSLFTKEHLFDYFAGRLTARQTQAIEEWTQEPAHQELFYQWLHEWEVAHPQYLAEVELALEDFRRILQQSLPATLPPDSLTGNGVEEYG